MKKKYILQVVLVLLFVLLGIWVLKPDKLILLMSVLLNIVVLVPFCVCCLLIKVKPVEIPEFLGAQVVTCKNNIWMYIICMEFAIFLGMQFTMDPLLQLLEGEKSENPIACGIFLLVLWFIVVPFLLLLRNDTTIFCTDGVIHRTMFGQIYCCAYDDITHSRTRKKKHGRVIMFYIGNKRVTVNSLSTNLDEAWELMNLYADRGGWSWWRWD